MCATDLPPKTAASAEFVCRNHPFVSRNGALQRIRLPKPCTCTVVFTITCDFYPGTESVRGPNTGSVPDTDTVHLLVGDPFGVTGSVRNAPLCGSTNATPLVRMTHSRPASFRRRRIAAGL